ncbi:MAG: hypothetical protein QM779_09885 [Propionicimonas sp.]|uniref:hypothetical protein n=1 Tax=Propionicimonas sp. TaxID=1955623 RepID=UPI003D106208
MDNQYWVQAAPFRALVGRLLDLSGLPWPVLASYAGVQPAVLQRLLYGRDGRASGRIPSDCARRLLDLDEGQLVRLGRLRRSAAR